MKYPHIFILAMVNRALCHLSPAYLGGISALPPVLLPSVLCSKNTSVSFVPYALHGFALAVPSAWSILPVLARLIPLGLISEDLLMILAKTTFPTLAVTFHHITLFPPAQKSMGS